MLGRQPAARLLLVDVGAVGDAEQRVVGVVEVAGREVHVVGGDERQVEVVGEADEAGLGRLLGGRARRAVRRVALDLDVEPAGEDRGEPLGQRAGARRVAVGDQRAERAVGAAGQADQAGGVGFERGEGTCGSAAPQSR